MTPVITRDGGRGLSEQLAGEAALVREHWAAMQEGKRAAVEASSVVVATLMTATQSGHIRRLLAGGHFNLVAIDEAGFTPG